MMNRQEITSRDQAIEELGRAGARMWELSAKTHNITCAVNGTLYVFRANREQYTRDELVQRFKDSEAQWPLMDVIHWDRHNEVMRFMEGLQGIGGFDATSIPLRDSGGPLRGDWPKIVADRIAGTIADMRGLLDRVTEDLKRAREDVGVEYQQYKKDAEQAFAALKSSTQRELNNKASAVQWLIVLLDNGNPTLGQGVVVSDVVLREWACHRGLAKPLPGDPQCVAVVKRYDRQLTAFAPPTVKGQMLGSLQDATTEEDPHAD